MSLKNGFKKIFPYERVKRFCRIWEHYDIDYNLRMIKKSFPIGSAFCLSILMLTNYPVVEKLIWVVVGGIIAIVMSLSARAGLRKKYEKSRYRMYIYCIIMFLAWGLETMKMGLSLTKIVNWTWIFWLSVIVTVIVTFFVTEYFFVVALLPKKTIESFSKIHSMVIHVLGFIFAFFCMLNLTKNEDLCCLILWFCFCTPLVYCIFQYFFTIIYREEIEEIVKSREEYNDKPPEKEKRKAFRKRIGK